MRAADRPTRRRLTWLPASRAGWWALALFAVAAAAVLFMGATAVAEEPQPGTFDHDPLLAAPAALAAVAGVGSAVLGGCAILRHERAVLVFLTTATGLNILAYVLGEVVR